MPATFRKCMITTRTKLCPNYSIYKQLLKQGPSRGPCFFMIKRTNLALHLHAAMLFGLGQSFYSGEKYVAYNSEVLLGFDVVYNGRPGAAGRSLGGDRRPGRAPALFGTHRAGSRGLGRAERAATMKL